MVKNLPAMQEAQVQSLGWENALEEGMATHSSILAWRIPWTEEHSGLQSIALQRVRQDFRFHFQPPSRSTCALQRVCAVLYCA